MWHNVGYRVVLDRTPQVELAMGSILCKTTRGLEQAIRETLRTLRDEVKVQELLGDRVLFIFWRNKPEEVSQKP